MKNAHHGLGNVLRYLVLLQNIYTIRFLHSNNHHVAIMTKWLKANNRTAIISFNL